MINSPAASNIERFDTPSNASPTPKLLRRGGLRVTTGERQTWAGRVLVNETVTHRFATAEPVADGLPVGGTGSHSDAVML